MALTDLGAATSNVNPAASVSMTTTAALANTESALVEVAIPNDGPTGISVTVGGHAATVVVTSSRATGVTTVLAGYKNATGSSIASGSTIAASWTNSGTQNGGGAGISALKTDKNIDPTTADTTGTGASFGSTASATSGTLSSATADYVAVSSEGHTNGGNSSTPVPPTGWTGSTLAWNATRTMGGRVAAIELAAPGTTAQTATWGNYPANIRWAATIALFKVTAAGGTTDLFSGSIAGAATVTGSVVRDRTLGPTVNGSANVTGAVVRTRSVASTSSGAATVTASIGRTRPLVLSSHGAATVTGGVGRVKTFAPSATGVATVSADLGGNKSVTASSAGVATVTGAIVRTRTLSGTSTGAASVSATIATGEQTVTAADNPDDPWIISYYYR